MCSRTWRACEARCAARSESSVASIESRYAASGTLASTITTFPPGSRTIRSGRSLPSSVVRRHLLVEVAVRQHARQLDDALELDLAPAAADMRRPEGAVASRARCAHSAAKAAHASAPYARSRASSSVRHLAVDLLERLLERLDVPGQLRLGDLQERRAVRLVARRRTLPAPRSRPSRRTTGVRRRARRALPASCRSTTPSGARRTATRRSAPRRRPRMRARMTIGPTNARDGVGRRRDLAAVRTHRIGTIARRWPGKIALPTPRNAAGAAAAFDARPALATRSGAACSTSSRRRAWSRSRSSSASSSSPVAAAAMTSRRAMEAGGCQLKTVQAQVGNHSAA